MKMYRVGGCVRDELLGVPSKDIDFSVVLDEMDLFVLPDSASPFEYMSEQLERKGFKIFREKPEFLTIRAQFPDETLPQRPGIISGTADLAKRTRKGLTADFVLARKESGYTDGRRPDKVEPGTLMDDLARRDFTMNAIAKDEHGKIIDPFNGQEDIKNRLIRTVGKPEDRFGEDALRILRALRFSVTKDFIIEENTSRAMWNLRPTISGVSVERVREELAKMFAADPLRTIHTINGFFLWKQLFDMGINLQPTLKEKVR